MSNISLNHAQIIDPLSFKSINLAKIYIGEYGTLPNPAVSGTWKQAYFVNSDGTRTAASQPIRTNAAGYAVDGSGNIKTIQVDGGYSLLVQDQYGATKFSQACSAANSGAVLEFDTIAGFTGALDGSVCYFKGRDTAGDGGGGPLRFLKGSTAPANGITVYAVTGGRLVREGWSVFGVSAKWAGAKGDGVTDDTVAIQLLLDSSFSNLYFHEGTYLYSNLTIPNRRITIFGDGHWRTVLQCSNPSNTNYGIASAAYVNNSTTGNEPVTIRELTVNGSNLVDFPLVIYGYYSEVRNSRVVNAKAGGRALKFTSNGISGSACSTTLVENKLIECTITGGDGDAFTITDSGAKCTDMIVHGNVFSDGVATFTSMAGHSLTGNHFYGGAVELNKLSTGTVIEGNYFENAVTLDDFKDEIVGLSGNRFVGRVSVNFGAGGKVCVFDGCLWHGTADLYHNYFAPDKRAIVNGGGFETATPVVFHNAASTGWVSFNDVFNYATSTFWTGSRQAAVSSIRQELPFAPAVSANFGDASATLTWTSSATTNRWTSTLTTDKTVTLSTTNAINGARFRIVRTGGGAFNLNVGTGPLKALAANQWCEVEYDGTAWFLSASGTL